MTNPTPGYDAALAAAEYTAVAQQRYIDQLADELQERHPDLLNTADHDPALFRSRLALAETLHPDPENP